MKARILLKFWLDCSQQPACLARAGALFQHTATAEKKAAHGVPVDGCRGCGPHWDDKKAPQALTPLATWATK